MMSSANAPCQCPVFSSTLISQLCVQLWHSSMLLWQLLQKYEHSFLKVLFVDISEFDYSEIHLFQILVYYDHILRIQGTERKGCL